MCIAKDQLTAGDEMPWAGCAAALCYLGHNDKAIKSLPRLTLELITGIRPNVSHAVAHGASAFGPAARSERNDNETRLL
ncbi:hypothetical protein EVAR_22883_1 [Eumeta japonica]|uniref:Uncharacterized protein n=1 Tax=Eumeta variegata TaxID=151549 RepID=A0A4C1UU07_EUMVA|nr:hypothetical protein EVAR_22883_1 [Eumeta japonica]